MSNECYTSVSIGQECGQMRVSLAWVPKEPQANGMSFGGWVLCDDAGKQSGQDLKLLEDSSGNCPMNWSVESFRINGATVFDLVHTSYPSTRNACADCDTSAGKCLKWNAALLGGGCVVFCLVSS